MEKTIDTKKKLKNEKSSENSYSHILKYTGLLGGVQGLNILVGIVRNKFTALFLGPSGMGLLSLFNSTASLLSNATNLGIPTSGVKIVADAKEQKARIDKSVALIRTYSLLSAVLGALICAVLGPILNLSTFTWGNHTRHFIFLAPTIFFTILAGGEMAILKGMGRLKALAKQASLLTLLSLFYAVPVYYFFGESGILGVLFLIAFSQWGLNFAFSRQVSPFRLNFSKMALLQGMPMIRLGISFVLAGLMNSGAEFLVRAFLNVQGDLEIVGLFNAGVTIVLVYGGMIFSVMESDYYPRLSAVKGGRLSENGVVERNLIINRQLEMNILMMGPIIIGLILLLPFIIPILYAHQFMGMLAMTQIAAAGLLFKAFYMPIEYLPLSRGEAKVFLIQESSCVLLLIICEISGYLLFGLTGLGAGIVAAYILESLGVFVFSNIYYAFRISFQAMKHLVIHLLNLILVAGVVCLWKTDSWCYWLLGLFLGLCSLAYSLFKITRSVKSK